jgi:hypothetical protein
LASLLLSACTIPIVLCGSLAVAQQAPAPPQDLVFKNATVMTASHGTIQHGQVWVHAGKIAGVGDTVNAPASATVIDGVGLWLTPGIIDPIPTPPSTATSTRPPAPSRPPCT